MKRPCSHVAPLTALALLALSAVTSRAAESNGVFNVLDFGARGDGTNDDTPAIQKTIDACAAQSGGQVLLPSGKTFLAGALTLRGGVDFHLASGAVLKGSANWRDYGREGALLFAKDARAITLSGDGTIDGNDRAVWQWLADEEAGGDVNKQDWWPHSFTGKWWPFDKRPGEPQKRGGRPMMVIFIGCQQVRMRDLTLRAAPSWTVHLVGCQDVAIHGLSIRNAWDVPNNDGIDLDHCRDVRISDCFLECADDGIVIKNTPNFASYGGSERITVTGCIVASRSAALKVDEVYTPPGARAIVFADCVVSHSNRGLCVQSRDEGDIADVLFANISVQTGFSPHKWWGAAEPIHISHFPRKRRRRNSATCETSASATFYATVKTGFSCTAGQIAGLKKSCSTMSRWKLLRPVTYPADFTICVRKGCSKGFFRANWPGSTRATSTDSGCAT